MSCSRCKHSKEIVNDYEWGQYHCRLYNKKRLAEMSCERYVANNTNEHSKTTGNIQVHEPSGLSF